jgi:hypothetical protein
MSTPYIANKTITVPAGKTIPYPIPGEVLYIAESTAAFSVELDNSPQIDLEAGLGVRFPSGKSFKKITFVNNNAIDITIKYYAGTAELMDNRLNTVIQRLIVISQKSFPTYTKGSGAIALANGASQTFGGTNGTDRRKQIVVTNLDVSYDLDLVDGSANLMDKVFPRSKWTMETDGVVTVKNSSGQPLNVLVTETFYDE